MHPSRRDTSQLHIKQVSVVTAWTHRLFQMTLLLLLAQEQRVCSFSPLLRVKAHSLVRLIRM